MPIAYAVLHEMEEIDEETNVHSSRCVIDTYERAK